MYNHDPMGTRSNDSEKKLGPENVGNLKVLWRVPTPGSVFGTPAVSDGVIYAGDYTGMVHAIRHDGQQLWTAQVADHFTASILATKHTLVIGDKAGNIYGLDKHHGAIRWKIRPNPHPLASIFGSATQVGENIAIGTTVDAEEPGVTPGEVVGGRGSVVLVDPTNGKVLWQTYMLTDAQVSQGATGASVWSTPTFDKETNSLYVTTGNNYNPPVTKTAEAIIAIDAATGKFRWVNQPRPSDSSPDLDYDFGDSPQIYRLKNGRKVVGAGQKSGVYYVLDAATGVVINQIRVEPGGLLGGLFADTAVHNGVVFANGTNWPGDNFIKGIPPVAGDLIAIAGDGSGVLWRFTTPGSPNLCGVAVANGVVYFQSLSDGNLYALDERTGDKLAQVMTGGTLSGPAVAQGRVYLGTGNSFALLANFEFKGTPGIVALGL
jgi:polyvinyl alcohol dehydrogenase (cytochrome)